MQNNNQEPESFTSKVTSFFFAPIFSLGRALRYLFYNNNINTSEINSNFDRNEYATHGPASVSVHSPRLQAKVIPELYVLKA